MSEHVGVEAKSTIEYARMVDTSPTHDPLEHEELSAALGAVAMHHTTEMRYEDAAERRTVEGWLCKTCRRWWGDDEHMARWCCCTDQPCACGQRRTKHVVVCDACRETSALARWEKRERRPYDGGMVYSDTLSRYFDDLEHALDWIAGEDSYDVDSLRLRLCDRVFAREIDGDDQFFDDLPEDCSLDDVARDIAEAIGVVNDIIAQRRRNGQQLSWRPSPYAVDLASVPPVGAEQAAPDQEPPHAL